MDSVIDKKLYDIHSGLNLKHGNFESELPEQKMVVKYLTGNEKILELGSNIGRNSLVIASILNDEKNLVTLESDVKISHQLQENRNLNNLTFNIENAALSNRQLIQKGWNTLSCNNFNKKKKKKGWNRVKTITLEKLKEKYKLEFDTLVLDCEGAFYYILKDMPEILTNINLIIMENDYSDLKCKNYVDSILLKNHFKRDYVESRTDKVKKKHCCYSFFFEVWKK